MAAVLQIVGAVLILAGYGGAQMGKLDQRSALYLLINLAGSLLLGGLALADDQWGFLLLEASWAVISAWGLLGLQRQRGPTGH